MTDQNMKLEDIDNTELTEASHCRQSTTATECTVFGKCHDISQTEMVDVRTILQPIITMGRCVAIFRPNKDEYVSRTKASKIRNLVYIFIVQLFLWAMSAKFGLVLFRAKELGRILPLLALFLHHVMYTYATFMSNLTFSKHYHKFVVEFNKHQSVYGNMRALAFLFKGLKYMTIYLISVTIISGSIYLIYLYIGREDFDEVIYPLNFNGSTNTVITMVIFTGHTFLLFTSFLVLSNVSNCLFVLILLLFHFLNKDLDLLISMHLNNVINDLDFESAIEKIRQRHVNIITLLQRANSMISHYIFCEFALSIPAVCFILYGTIRNILADRIIYLMSFMAFSYLSMSTFYVVVSSILSKKAHAPLDIVMKVDVCKLTDKAYKSVTLFISELTGQAIGFDVYGLFTLDSTAILMLLGTFVTYAVVMLQFTGESSKDCTALISNRTCEVL